MRRRDHRYLSPELEHDDSLTMPKKIKREKPDDLDGLDNVHRLILERIPDTNVGRPIRLALTRLYWAASNVELQLPFVASYLDTLLDNPPWSIWSGPDEAQRLAKQLEHLAREIRRSVAAMNAAKPLWKRFAIPPEGSRDAVSVREDRHAATTQTRSEDWDTPF